MNSTDPIHCPECGQPVPAASQHRVCPACLLRQALDSGTLVDGASYPAAAAPPSPAEIADKFPQFEITQCLGRGGMGVVYKARQKSLDRWVAIKILPPERIGEEKFAERFSREAATLAKLSHPNIVTIHDFGETGGLFYIVMEYVDGVNLRDLLREGKLDPQQALAIVPPICEALQYAHDKGIVHRDIKPENLLLDRDGRLKIADFGIAKLIEPVAAACDRRTSPDDNQRQSQTAATLQAGTHGYAAPEQANGTADHRADIYALGVVLYEMLTGERPAKELVAPSKKVQLDVRLDEMVLRALEKSPELRYQTAGEFRTVIETIAESRAPESFAPDQVFESFEATPPPGTKRLALIVISVLLIVPLLLLGLSILASYFMRPHAANGSDGPMIGRVVIIFEHPASLSGGFGVNIPVHERGDSGWFPNPYQTISLKSGKALNVRARVSVTSSGHPEAFVSTSTNGTDWETESAPIGPQRSNAALRFAGGLQSSIRWQSQLNTDVSVTKESPVGRFVDHWRIGAKGLLALGVLAFISVMVAKKRPGMVRRWWWIVPLMIPLGTCLGLLVATLNRSLRADEFEASTIVEVGPTTSADPFHDFFEIVAQHATSPETLGTAAKRLDLASRWKLAEPQVIAKLAGAVSAENIRGTDLLAVRVQTTDAKESSDLANAITRILKEEHDSRLTIHQTATPPTIPAPLKPIGSSGPVTGALLSPLLALALMGFLHRRYPAPQRFVQKDPRPSDPNSRFHGRLSFGLFLAGTLGTLLLMTLSPRHELALVFGALAVVASLILGLMSWREPLSKFVVITVAAAFSVMVGVSLVVFSLRAAAVDAAKEQALKAEMEATRSMNLEIQNRTPQPERQPPNR